MHSSGIRSDINDVPAEEPSRSPAGDPCDIEAIHRLIQSGDYHVPASAIAERMIERIFVDKRGGTP